LKREKALISVRLGGRKEGFREKILRERKEKLKAAEIGGPSRAPLGKKARKAASALAAQQEEERLRTYFDLEHRRDDRAPQLSAAGVT